MTLSSSQKIVLSVLVAALLVSLTVAAWGVAKWGFARSGKPDVTRGITVIDSAQVKAPPDTAFITFSVVNKDRNARNAARANAEKTTAVTRAILKAEIPKSDVQTTDYSLEPEMNWDKNPPPIVGYTASNTVRVRTKDMEKIGELIDAAINAGANSVRGVRFDVEDKRALRGKALSLAVKKAEGKAQAIAKALGANLGPAVSASETVNEYVPESRNYKVMARYASVAQTPISVGEASVSAQVKVVYSVR